ncbi:methyltransferase domain-containing protein, partial [Crocinitomicaceae bacterium]|nr:methyltransferase domain-containing protein [Crocinitomicaceae bacterium]
MAFPEGSRILDIGCGSGRDAAMLLEGGHDVRGIEPSSRLRQISQELHPTLAGRIETGAFPQSLSNVEETDKYDGVLCSAVLEHLPKSRFFDSAYAIKDQLKPHGRVLVSFASERDGLDESSRDIGGRLFTPIIPDELALLFERTGFQCIGKWTDPDSLGRNHAWHTLLFELRSTGLARPLDLVEAVLSRDKKVATYKLALFRALCDIALTQPHSVQWRRDGTVGVSIDAVADRWIIYYWPLFASDQFLPQMQQEWKAKVHKLAFASQLEALREMYDKLGGLSAYAVDRRRGSLPDYAKAAAARLLKALKDAIRYGPVTHAGGSLESGQIFGYEKGGTIVVSASLWSEICLMGHWIQDALILRWAELTSRLSKGSVRPEAVVSQLLVIPDPDRETQAARQVFEDLKLRECVWSGRDLRRGFVVDHVLPFSLWRNNDLWNLLPAHPRVNGQKSDRLP